MEETVRIQPKPAAKK